MVCDRDGESLVENRDSRPSQGCGSGLSLLDGRIKLTLHFNLRIHDMSREDLGSLLVATLQGGVEKGAYE